MANNDVQLSVTEKYTQARNWCIERFGPEFCESILPRKAPYLPEEHAKIHPIWFFVAGFIMGKLL